MASAAAKPGSTRLLFAPGQQPGALAAEDVAELLGGDSGAQAACEGPLDLGAPGATTTCTGPAGVESSESVEWTAHAVRTPNPEEPSGTPGAAVLFTSGDPLTAEVQRMLETGQFTGAGVGGAFGMEPLDAPDLEETTASLLNGDFTYVPLGAAWSGGEFTRVRCDAGLDVQVFTATRCTATGSDGREQPVDVLPGTFVNNEYGLLLSLPAQAPAAQ